MGAIASHLWQSTLVAAVAAVLAWFLRNNSASVRYWIWFAASVKFLVPLAVFVAAAAALPWPESAFDSSAVAAANVLFNSPALPSMSPTSYGALVLVWAAGAIVLLARWLWEWYRMTSMARGAEVISDGPVLDALRRLEPTVGIFRPTKLVCSQHNLEPGIIGIRTPVLVWPRHLSAGLRDDHIQPIVAHELAHVVRRDNLLASFHMLVCAAFWFFPVVWWIGMRLIEERERACDEHVLALGQSPSAYAAGILKTCELCIASPLVNVPGITGGDLKKRISRIMESRVGAPLDLVRRFVVGVAAIVLFVVPTTAGAVAPPVRVVKSEHSTSATNDKIEGDVRMECTVRTDDKPSDFRMECVVRTGGTPSDIRIVQSLDRALDHAAGAPARQRELEPGMRREKPVPVMVTVGIAFNLK